MTRSTNEQCKIYLLTNKVNNKIYIGQTWLEYDNRMGKYGEKYRNSPYLYAAIQKYGVENFEYKTLIICDTQEMADDVETFYIEAFNSKNHKIGYNLKDGGRGGKHSEETKAKIAKTLQDVADTWTKEERKARAGVISTYWLGKTREPLSEERKESITDHMLVWHAENTHPMQGKHHTEEAKHKISTANKGKKRSKESIEQGRQKQFMSPEREQDMIQSYLNHEVIANILKKFKTSASCLYRVLNRNGIERHGHINNRSNHTHSEESKQKMSEIKTEYWKNKKLNG